MSRSSQNGKKLSINSRNTKNFEDYSPVEIIENGVDTDKNPYSLKINHNKGFV